MTPLLLLLLSASAPIYEQPFRLERPAEAVAVIDASCERCDWAVPGREAAVLALSLDGAASQHLVLVRGTRAEYRVLLGALGEGEHRLALTLDARWSARGIGAVRVDEVKMEAVAADDPRHEALAHAPILHTRKGSLQRFSDAPLVAWVESFPAADGGRELRYSIVFSHEDGGTPLDRLMATWGRATDIELVYAVELDANGRVRRATFQGKDHVTTRFGGRREASHPVLYVVTKNNMVSDRGKATPRVALVPVPFSLDGVSREAVMDAHPWTHHVSAVEVRREGLVRDEARPGSKRIPDPRRFVFLEACGMLSDARLAFDVALRRADGALQWYASDAGRPDFRIARSGCFRAGVALPREAAASDVQAVRLRAHTRLPRRGEKPLPRGAGMARIERVNLLYGLGADDWPGPSLLRWNGGSELAPDGPPLELPLRRAAANPETPKPRSPWTLTPSQVEELEKRVADNPDDLESRGRLLRHYFAERADAARAARARHVLWVVTNAPEADIAGPDIGFDKISETENYVEARTLWLRHVESNPKNTRILANAAEYLLLSDRAEAESLLERGAAIEPGNPRWNERLAQLYMLDARRLDKADPEAARKALEQYEAALAAGSPPAFVLANAAQCALWTGDDAKAAAYASELLRHVVNPAGRPDGSAIHDGHRILGHVALNAGDVEGARLQLVESAKTPGSPVLNSFGPELTLAKDLLEKGEREAVIEYLESLRRFWVGRQQAIDEWVILIRAGQTPDLDRFRARRANSSAPAPTLSPPPPNLP